MVKSARPAPVNPAAAPDLLPEATTLAIDLGGIADAVTASAGAVIMLWNNNTAAVEPLWRHHAYLLPPALAHELIDAGDARSATAIDLEIAGHQLRDLTAPPASEA